MGPRHGDESSNPAGHRRPARRTCQTPPHTTPSVLLYFVDQLNPRSRLTLPHPFHPTAPFLPWSCCQRTAGIWEGRLLTQSSGTPSW